MQSIQSFPPLAGSKPAILILGSIPGRKSLEDREYYAHPSNQFWRILAALYSEPVPEDYPAKKMFLQRRRIALWDVLAACQRKASEDASIRAALPNRIDQFLDSNPGIRKIVLNGKAAEKYFLKHFAKSLDIPFCVMPSTSPAHAALNFETKLRAWKTAFADLEI